MAGFNNTDYLLKNGFDLTDGGFTVPVWYEYKSVGKKLGTKIITDSIFFQVVFF